MKGHIGSYHCCLFGVVHLFNTHLTSTPDLTPSFPSERRISMYLMMFKVVVTTTARSFLPIFFLSSSSRLSFLFCFFFSYLLFKGLVGPEWLEAESGEKKQERLLLSTKCSHIGALVHARKPQARRSRLLFFLSRCVSMLRICRLQKKNTQTRGGRRKTKGWVPSAGCT